MHPLFQISVIFNMYCGYDKSLLGSVLRLIVFLEYHAMSILFLRQYVRLKIVQIQIYKNVRSMTIYIMNKLDIIISRPKFYTRNKQTFLSKTNQSHTHSFFTHNSCTIFEFKFQTKPADAL